MGRLINILLAVVAGIVGIAVIAILALYLFFDPNDFREDISAKVKDRTGRDLVIEGDLSLSVFPWIAVAMGKTTLGNAAGFADDTFLSFGQARLRVKLLPWLFSQRIEIDTASLDGLEVNLAVAKNGATNWDDLLTDAEETPDAPGDESSSDGVALDITSIGISDTKINYVDAQAGTAYAIAGLSMSTGRIAAGSPFDVDAEFDFDVKPENYGGQLSLRGTILMSENGEKIAIDGLSASGDLRGIGAAPMVFNFDCPAVSVDTAAQSVSLDKVDLVVLGISMSAVVEPFSYAGTLQPRATLRTQEFSLKDVLRNLGETAPETVDPNALERVSFSADAAVGDTAISLSKLSLKLDDTAIQGSLSLPTGDTGVMQFELVADRINLDNYMAPAVDEELVDDAGETALEIPVDIIRALEAKGSFKLKEATLSGMAIENVAVVINSTDGKLRLYPISAELFDGMYDGDVRIDASTDIPSVAVNEKIVDVQLTPLVKAMFDVANVSGTINGTFALTGRGADMNAIRQDLDGKIAFELNNGVWEGTDIWYQLRRARATLRREPQPTERLPARTEFSEVSASGNVVDGIMLSNDLIAELPFMRLTGAGIVDFQLGEVDYSLQARIVERPELMKDATDAEIADFTAAVIPLKITGTLTAPKFGIDIEGMLRSEVEKAVEKEKTRIRDSLLDAVLGRDKETEEVVDDETADGEAKKKKKKNKLEDALKDLIRD